jgi:hypothetical protein
MKTGSKIFFGYWIVIAVLMLLLLIYIRLNIHKYPDIVKSDIKELTLEKVITLNDFKHIRVSNIENFVLRDSSANLFKVEYTKTGISNDLYFRKSGDTLVVDSVGKDVKKVILYCNLSDKYFNFINSEVMLKDTSLQKMNIILNNSKLYKWKGEAVSFLVRHLNLTVTNQSEVHIFNAQIDTLMINLNDSKVYISGKSDNIFATLEDNSKFDCSSAIEYMQLKKDKSSKVNLGKED